MSARYLRGITPARLVNPIVDRMPTSDACDEGPRMELPVSLPRPKTQKLDATAAAVPPLEPAGTRFMSYGLRVVPRIELTVSIGENAHSAMFDLARTMAPAFLMRATRNASLLDTNPLRVMEPLALCRPLVSKLSFTIAGMQWSGPVRPDFLNFASCASASAIALGLVATIALSGGSFLSFAAIRSRYALTRSWQVSCSLLIAAWIFAIVVSSISNAGAA